MLSYGVEHRTLREVQRLLGIQYVLPKKAGGLGLRMLGDLNQLFGLKIIWLLFAANGSLWVAWIKKMVIRDRLFWSTNFQHSGNWILRRLLKLRDLTRPFLFCQVNSGFSSLFLYDDWAGLDPLMNISGPKGPRVSGISTLSSVNEAYADGIWNLSRGRHPILVLLRSCLPPDLLASLSQEPALFLWRNSA